MKKAFLIFFVLVAAIGACFATTGDYLKLTTSIAKEKPEFIMEGNTVLGTQTGAQVNVGSPVDGNVEVDMTLTAPTCPVAGVLPGQAAAALAALDGVGIAKVNLVWEPAWSPDRLTEEAKAILEMF